MFSALGDRFNLVLQVREASKFFRCIRPRQISITYYFGLNFGKGTIYNWLIFMNVRRSSVLKMVSGHMYHRTNHRTFWVGRKKAQHEQWHGPRLPDVTWP
jgi:hypothetical protein